MALVKAGADRQVMHEHLRQLALSVCEQVNKGKPNPLVEVVFADSVIKEFLNIDRFSELIRVDSYTGFAPERARSTDKEIKQALEGISNKATG